MLYMRTKTIKYQLYFPHTLPKIIILFVPVNENFQKFRFIFYLRSGRRFKRDHCCWDLTLINMTDMYNACPYFPHGTVFHCFQVMIFLYHSCFLKSQCLKKEKKKRRKKKKRYCFMYFFVKRVQWLHPSF